MFHDGRGTEQNFEKAYYYYLLASQKGHADARKNAEFVYARLPLTTTMRIQLEVSRLKNQQPNP